MNSYKKTKSSKKLKIKATYQKKRVSKAFIDPREFKRSFGVGEFEISVRALKPTKFKKSRRVTKFARRR